MKGIVVTNGYYESAASRNQAERTIFELVKLGAEVSEYKNIFPYVVGKGDGTKHPESDVLSGTFALNELKNIDFALFFDKDINLARHLENAGIRVFNSSKTIEDADDKIRTAEILASRGISVPMTIPAPKRYSDQVDRAFLQRTAEILGLPIVMKLSKGSLGREVFLANDVDELIALDEKYPASDRLYQKFVKESFGQSYRVITIGGKYFCAMHLTNDTDFRSNAAQGGKAESVELPAEYIEVAERAAQALNCDYCGVDLFCSEPTVIELNSNAYFMSMEKTSGKNVAQEYAKYVLERMQS